jgi:hypothetical protein
MNYSVKVWNWDRVKMAENLTMEELVKLDAEVKARPENQVPPSKNSIWLYTSSARKKIDNISWAITIKLAEKKSKGV